MVCRGTQAQSQSPPTPPRLSRQPPLDSIRPNVTDQSDLPTMVRNGYLLAINCNVSYTKFAGAQVRILVETGVNFRRDVETRSKATRAYIVMEPDGGRARGAAPGGATGA